MKKDALKIGDKIRVLKRPRQWSSLLSHGNPLTLEFPRIITIDKISGLNIRCEDDYGWHVGSDAHFEYELLDDNEEHFLGFI